MFFRVAESEDDSRFRGIEKCLQNYKIYHGQANLGIESNIRGAVKRYIYCSKNTNYMCIIECGDMSLVCWIAYYAIAQIFYALNMVG